ncbi:hypothetical protein PoB_005588800 [Plakobranchus ocellatus]|uniref:Uncharacterized protein n=1 Tax=Plakobranchus ocellatus TaxID=259542 RepID=A0AAV4CEK0_9GAST|nr:hypothetical protein PoB_005588800 [Plakobranchus ocellatus]
MDGETSVLYYSWVSHQRRALFRCWTTDLLRLRVILVIMLLTSGYWMCQKFFVPTKPSSTQDLKWESFPVKMPVQTHLRNKMEDVTGLLDGRVPFDYPLGQFDHQVDVRFALGVATKRPIEEIDAEYKKIRAEGSVSQTAT